MVKCAVQGCNKDSRRDAHENLHYFRIPKAEKLRSKWLAICQIARELKDPRVCSIHFRDEDYEKKQTETQTGFSPQNRRQLLPKAVPSLLLPGCSSETHGKEEELAISSSPPLLETPIQKIDRIIEENREILEDLDAEQARRMATPEPDYSDIDETREEDWQDFTDLAAPLETVAERTAASPAFSQDSSKAEKIPKGNPFARLRRAELIQQLTVKSKHIEQLKEANAYLENEVKERRRTEEVLKDKARIPERLEDDRLEKILSDYFAPTQVQKIILQSKGIKKNLHWSPEDIADFITLRSISPKAYRYFRLVKKHPYADMATLYRWARKFPIREGLMHRVMMLVKMKGKEMEEADRLLALCFDEMSVRPLVDFNFEEQRIIGPHSKVQIIMVRGIKSNFKQPIYYKFDQPMKKSILDNAITELYNASFIVLSVCCDLGGDNQGLLSEYKVSIEKPYFEHPCDSKIRIYWFADAPHMLKLLRNHFLDQGYLIPQDVLSPQPLSDPQYTTVSKQVVQQMLQAKPRKGPLDPTFKVKFLHLNCNENERQNVKLAAQLFSHRFGTAVKYYGERGWITYRNYEEASFLFLTVNKWFDVENSDSEFDSTKERCAYGKYLELQNKALDDMYKVAGRIRPIKGKVSNSLLPFQKGILLSINALKGLYHDWTANYNQEYIITRRVNQDTIENLNSTMRGTGRHEKPSSNELQYRMKNYILGRKATAIFVRGRNTEESTGEKLLLSPKTLRNTQALSEQPEAVPEGDQNTTETMSDERDNAVVLTSNMLGFLNLDSSSLPEVDDPDDWLAQKISDEIEEEALRDFCGYVAYKYALRYPHLQAPESTTKSAEQPQKKKRKQLKPKANDKRTEQNGEEWRDNAQKDAPRIPSEAGTLAGSEQQDEDDLEKAKADVAKGVEEGEKMIKHWTEYRQHTNLTIPAPDFVREMTVVYEFLEAFHGREFDREASVLDRFFAFIRPRVGKLIHVPDEVLKFFIKTLTLFKVKQFNRKATDRAPERMVKRKSKVSKHYAHNVK